MTNARLGKLFGWTFSILAGLILFAGLAYMSLTTTADDANSAFQLFVWVVGVSAACWAVGRTGRYLLTSGDRPIDGG